MLESNSTTLLGSVLKDVKGTPVVTGTNVTVTTFVGPKTIFVGNNQSWGDGSPSTVVRVALPELRLPEPSDVLVLQVLVVQYQ